VRNFPILFRMYYTSVTHSILLVHTCMITRIFQYFVIRNLGTYFSSQTYKWGSTRHIYIFSAAWNWSFILKRIWNIHIITDLISSKQHLQHVWKLHMWFFCPLNTVFINQFWKRLESLTDANYLVNVHCLGFYCFQNAGKYCRIKNITYH